MERAEMTLRIPIWLNDELKQTAKNMGISRHAFILQVLCQWAEQLNNERE